MCVYHAHPFNPFPVDSHHCSTHIKPLTFVNEEKATLEIGVYYNQPPKLSDFKILFVCRVGFYLSRHVHHASVNLSFCYTCLWYFLHPTLARHKHPVCNSLLPHLLMAAVLHSTFMSDAYDVVRRIMLLLIPFFTSTLALLPSWFFPVHLSPVCPLLYSLTFPSTFPWNCPQRHTWLQSLPVPFSCLPDFSSCLALWPNSVWLCKLNSLNSLLPSQRSVP